MAAQLARRHSSFLNSFVRSQKITHVLERRSMIQYRCCTEWLMKRRVSSQQFHCIRRPHSSKFSTTIKYNTSSANTNEDSLGSMDSLCQEVVRCSSSEQILNTIENKTDLTPQQMSTVLECLVKKKYAELCAELPWFSSKMYRSHSQLNTAYDADSKMSSVHNHPGTTVLVESIERYMGSMENEHFASIANWSCLLNLDKKDLSLDGLREELSKRLDSLSLKDLRMASYVLSDKYFKHKDYTVQDRLSENMLNRVENILVHNCASTQTPDDWYDFLTTMLILHHRSSYKRWHSILNSNLRHIVINPENLVNVDHLAMVCSVMNRMFTIDHEDESLEKVSETLMKQAHLLPIRSLQPIEMMLRKKPMNRDLSFIICKRVHELFEEQGDTLRPADLSDLLNGFVSKYDAQLRRKFEERFQQFDFKGIDVFSIGSLAYNFMKFNDKDLINRFQTVWLDHAEGLVKYATYFKNIELLLRSQPFVNVHVKETFVRKMLIELQCTEDKSNFMLANLARALLPHSHDGYCEPLVDALMERIPHLPQASMAIAGRGLLEIRLKSCTSTHIKEKMERMLGLFYVTFGQKLKNGWPEDPGINNFLTLSLRMASINRKFAGGMATTLKEIAFKNMTETEAYKMCRVLRETSYFDEDLCEQLAERFIEHESVTKFPLLLLILFEQLGYTPKKKEAFFSRLMSLYHQLERHDEVPFRTKILKHLILMQCYPMKELSEIFTVDFLEEVDNWLKENPELRHETEVNMFLLNRSVVLECPELNIPFFTDYVYKAYMAEGDKRRMKLNAKTREEIYGSLLHLVNGDSSCVQESVYAPYYHLIDFEMLLDEAGNLVSVDLAENKTQENWQRVAVLALWNDCYCPNVNRLKGHHRTKIRHLELMGYKVVQIPHFEWNSMALGDDEARKNYLREKIWGDSKNTQDVPRKEYGPYSRAIVRNFLKEDLSRKNTDVRDLLKKDH